MFIKKLKVALGIMNKKIYTGPIEVSIDLTNKCNLDCVMCWWKSHLIKERPRQDELEYEINYETLVKLIKDLKAIDVKSISFGGKGEPFLYKNLFNAIGETKKLGIQAVIITNGFFLHEENLKKCLEYGVDILDVSVHSANKDTYKKIHPTQSIETFGMIKENLKSLDKIKKESGRKSPKVLLRQVVCSYNYREVVDFVELAKELGADTVGFKRMDVFPGGEELLLNEKEKSELSLLMDKAEIRAKELKLNNTIWMYKKHVLPGVTTGEYTISLHSHIPCYSAWRYARVLVNGDVIPCCGCYDIILGNLKEASFIDIWNSKKYNDLRQEMIKADKSKLIEQGCKCYSCVDYGPNQGIYKKLHPFKSKTL